MGDWDDLRKALNSMRMGKKRFHAVYTLDGEEVGREIVLGNDIDSIIPGSPDNLLGRICEDRGFDHEPGSWEEEDTSTRHGRKITFSGRFRAGYKGVLVVEFTEVRA